MTRQYLQDIAFLLIMINAFALLGYALRRSQDRAIARSIDFDEVGFDNLSNEDWEVLVGFAEDVLARLECNDGCQFCEDRTVL